MRVNKCDFPGHATWTLTAENDGEYLMLEMLIRALRRTYPSSPRPGEISMETDVTELDDSATEDAFGATRS